VMSIVAAGRAANTREQKYEMFRALHARAGLFVIPNPWDAGSARILTVLGFEALATTSAGYAFSAGRVDSFRELTREGLLANAKAIVEATPLPVSADMQNGFGQAPEACAEMVRLAAGVGRPGDPSRTRQRTRRLPSMSSSLRWSGSQPRRRR